jgi:hypothetical protein
VMILSGARRRKSGWSNGEGHWSRLALGENVIIV